MENIFNTRNFIMLALLFLAIGCQKQEFKDPSLISGASATGYENRTGCRMTLFDYYDGFADYHAIDTYTYKDGLVDEWTVWYGQVFKMEYNEKGKLIRSKVYEEGMLVATVDFFL